MATDKTNTKRRIVIRSIIIWILRVLVGVTFIFSGFTKIVDPWGFFYKIQEYLHVWEITWVWRELVQSAALGIGLVEFCAGVFMLLGCMRRTVALVMLFMMAALLPLTVNIYIASPVSDCGCFGDALVLSNRDTLLKNIVLTAAIIYLVFNNRKARCLIQPLVQWMAMVVCVVYCLIVGLIGFGVQPIVDFRNYPVGSKLIDDEDIDTDNLSFVYAKDGLTRTFTIDSLPDSTWTFVSRAETIKTPHHSSLAIFDGDDDVTNEVITDETPQLLLIVNEPDQHGRARAGMANNLNNYISKLGGNMIGIIATDSERLNDWKQLTKPTFDVYTSDDTSLKEVARGISTLVYLEDGIIKWKRNIYSLPGDYPDFTSDTNQLENIYVVDDGRLFKIITSILIMLLILMIAISLRHTSRVRKHLSAIRANHKPEQTTTKNA